MGKVAFVLSGGSSKGSYQVGCIKKLVEQGIKPDVIYGTSVGALNATGYAFGGVETLEKIWKSINKQRHIIRFQWSSLLFMRKGLYSTKPLRKIVNNIVASHTVLLCEPKVVMVEIETGEVAYVSPANASNYNMSYVDAVIASATMPIVMEPVRKVWVDGGIRENTPLSQAIRDGADEIYVIACNPWTKNLTIIEKTHNFLDVGLRMVDVMVQEIFVNDIKTCLKLNNDPDYKFVKLHVFCPPHIWVDLLDFSQEKIQEGMKLGYEAKELEQDFLCSV
jgi:NTE family protein